MLFKPSVQKSNDFMDRKKLNKNSLNRYLRRYSGNTSIPANNQEITVFSGLPSTTNDLYIREMVLNTAGANVSYLTFDLYIDDVKVITQSLASTPSNTQLGQGESSSNMRYRILEDVLISGNASLRIKSGHSAEVSVEIYGYYQFVVKEV